jgi:hypothetical protein
MLSIEEYIAPRKKEDKLNEFDIDARTQNMKICVDYIFEYFSNYLNITEAEEKTVLHDEKLSIGSSLGSMTLKFENGLLVFTMNTESKYTNTLEIL